MGDKIADTPTITITPKGSTPSSRTSLGNVSLNNLQALKQELASYTASENRLMNVSAELLSVCGTLERLEAGEQVNAARTELARAIIDLKYKVVRLDYPPSVAENLCLLYSIVLDEFILTRQTRHDSGWENRTLVADLFGFRDGGDRFYEIANRALLQPKALREFLEIVYVFLKLGYKGKHIRSTEQEREKLINRIEMSLGLVSSTMASSKSMGREVRSYIAPKRFITTKAKIIVAAVVIVLITIGAYSYRIHAEHVILTDFQEKRSARKKVSTVSDALSSDNNSEKKAPVQ